jgi:hypothetical protein
MCRHGIRRKSGSGVGCRLGFMSLCFWVFMGCGLAEGPTAGPVLTFDSPVDADGERIFRTYLARKSLDGCDDFLGEMQGVLADEALALVDLDPRQAAGVRSMLQRIVSSRIQRLSEDDEADFEAPPDDPQFGSPEHPEPGDEHAELRWISSDDESGEKMGLLVLFLRRGERDAAWETPAGDCLSESGDARSAYVAVIVPPASAGLATIERQLVDAGYEFDRNDRGKLEDFHVPALWGGREDAPTDGVMKQCPEDWIDSNSLPAGARGPFDVRNARGEVHASPGVLFQKDSATWFYARHGESSCFEPIAKIAQEDSRLAGTYSCQNAEESWWQSLPRSALEGADLTPEDGSPGGVSHQKHMRLLSALYSYQQMGVCWR